MYRDIYEKWLASKNVSPKLKNQLLKIQENEE